MKKNRKQYLKMDKIKIKPMQQILIVIFCSFSIYASSQNQWQTIDYKDVSVQIPSKWGNKNTVNYFESSNITEYQISAWANDSVTKLLVIQWLDIEVERELYIETIIDTQKERFLLFKQLQYEKIVDIDFLGYKAKKCHFYGNPIKGIRIEGDYIAFTKNEYSYIVLISGYKNFYQSDDYKHILNSIKPNFSGSVPQKNSNVKMSFVEDNFTRFEFKNYSLSVPNTMELRDENSMMSLGIKIYRDNLKAVKKIDVGDLNFVFQPAGTDDIQDSDRQKKAMSLYSRVLINYQKGTKDDYYSWNDSITFTQAEYNEVNKIFKDNLLATLSKAKQMSMNMEFLNIGDVKISKNANKFVYIEQQYERKGLKGSVIVIDYYLFNNDEMVKLTISYRKSESNLWKTDFDKIIDTFSFTTKK